MTPPMEGWFHHFWNENQPNLSFLNQRETTDQQEADYVQSISAHSVSLAKSKKGHVTVIAGAPILDLGTFTTSTVVYDVGSSIL